LPITKDGKNKKNTNPKINYKNNNPAKRILTFFQSRENMQAEWKGLPIVDGSKIEVKSGKCVDKRKIFCSCASMKGIKVHFDPGYFYYMEQPVIRLPFDPPRYTYDDYVRWSDEWELIDRYPYSLMPSPIREHQRFSKQFTVQVENMLAGKK
jgi:hypothetical protein